MVQDRSKLQLNYAEIRAVLRRGVFKGWSILAVGIIVGYSVGAIISSGTSSPLPSVSFVPLDFFLAPIMLAGWFGVGGIMIELLMATSTPRLRVALYYSALFVASIGIGVFASMRG
jgi:hypothetical protein